MLQLVQSLRTGLVEVVELPDPVPRSRQVLVRTSWSLISPGTEQAVARTAGKSLVGKALDRPDQVRKVLDKAARDGIEATVSAVRARLDDLLTPGYSSAGTVELVGPDVPDLRPGDRVACVGANAACHAELAVVPAALCLRVPDGLDDKWASFAALGAIAGHGVRLADVTAGSTVVVVGLGLVGQLAAQLVSAAGGRVVAIDSDRSRVDLARSLGAVAGASPQAGDAREAVMLASNGVGADAVVIAAAANDSAPIELAAALARDRAAISVVGDVKLDVPRAPFYEKELQLRVSRSYGPGRYDPEYEEEGHDYPIGYVRWTQRRLIAYFLEELAAARVRLEPLVTHEFPIARGVDAYAALDDPGRLAIMLRYDAASRPAPSPRMARPVRAPVAGSSRIGLIGPGLFARSTLLPLLAREEAEVVALAGGRGATALAAARQHGCRTAASATELIESDDVDVVIVATRHDSHAELAELALRRGKAVFLEKPLSIDREGVERLRPLLHDDARLVVDFNRRFAPATVQAREALDGRRDPLMLSYRVNAGALPADHWLRRPDQGGGRLVGEGCHFVDLCSALVGGPVESFNVASLPPGPRTLPHDSFVLILRYGDGSIATVSYVATGSARMPKERVEIVGAGRSLVIEDFRRLRRYGRLASRPSLPIGQDKGHAALLRAALRFFREGGAPPVPYEDLIATTEVTLAARIAVRSEGGWTAL